MYQAIALMARPYLSSMNKQSPAVEASWGYRVPLRDSVYNYNNFCRQLSVSPKVSQMLQILDLVSLVRLASCEL